MMGSNLANRKIPRPSFQPTPPGRLHPTLQQYDSLAHDIPSLRAVLGSEDPFLNWIQNASSAKVDPSDVLTWFPQDDEIAFYTPVANRTAEGAAVASPARPGEDYDQLSYRELHALIHKCPRFDMNTVTKLEGCSSFSDENEPIVGVALPNELMAEMGVVLLSVIAKGGAVAPMDGRQTALSLLQALNQLKCTHLVSTATFLADLNFLSIDQTTGIYVWNPASIQAESNDSEVRRNLQILMGRIKEIRLIAPSAQHGGNVGAGRLEWTVLQKMDKSEESTLFHFKETSIKESATRSLSTGRDPSRPVLFLRTSGTTSTPKIVPLSAPHLLYAALSLASATELKREDCNANAMPYFHIGGIASNLLGVLVSGSSVIMNGPLSDPNAYLNQISPPKGHPMHENLKKDRQFPSEGVCATYYYAAPSIHKLVLLTAEARRVEYGYSSLPSKLRLIRNAAAHLSHDTALGLSGVFQTKVIPTYGMSEAMPICFSAPIDVRYDVPAEVVDSVGYPVGASLRIVNENGVVLPHVGSTIDVGKIGDEKNSWVGEIEVRGAGVIKHYLGIDVHKTHSPGGWLKTGDMGVMDNKGRVFIKGRSKEMIKRGGEQVWPIEVDDVVEKIPGVATAVTFGVPNELWGEEVAVAVVLKAIDGNEAVHDEEVLRLMRNKINDICREKLDDASRPRQIKFLPSVECLLRGPTGKYKRSKMASHLGVKAVDTAAMRVLRTMNRAVDTMGKGDQAEKFGANEYHAREPSQALNGLRFWVACCVVFGHAGVMPNAQLAKLQSFSLNMILFFGIAAFKLAASTKAGVSYPLFVATKLGTLHALFVVAQGIALPSYLLFECGENGYRQTFESWQCDMGEIGKEFAGSILLTPFVRPNDINPVTWFQTSLYGLLLLFPILNQGLRCLTRGEKRRQHFAIIVLGVAALYVPWYITVIKPKYFMLSYSLLSWIPECLLAMVLGYRFVSQSTSPASKEQKILIGRWTDALSIALLLCVVVQAFAPAKCFTMWRMAFQAMRPHSTRPTQKWLKVCDVSFKEWSDFIHPWSFDGYSTDFGYYMRWGRLGTPLALAWMYCLAFGYDCLTVRFLTNRINLALGPLAYPLYLLHPSILRYYWVATRGLKAHFWYRIPLVYRVPIELYEVILVIVASTALGWFLNKHVVPHVMPYTMKFFEAPFSLCKRRSKHMQTASLSASTSYDQISEMVERLTGGSVRRDLRLSSLGLDSLGAAALLGTLRTSVPLAKDLDLKQLSKFETVGQLADFLDGLDKEDEENQDLESGRGGVLSKKPILPARNRLSRSKTTAETESFLGVESNSFLR